MTIFFHYTTDTQCPHIQRFLLHLIPQFLLGTRYSISSPPSINSVTPYISNCNRCKNTSIPWDWHHHHSNSRTILHHAQSTPRTHQHLPDRTIRGFHHPQRLNLHYPLNQPLTRTTQPCPIVSLHHHHISYSLTLHHFTQLILLLSSTLHPCSSRPELIACTLLLEKFQPTSGVHDGRQHPLRRGTHFIKNFTSEQTNAPISREWNWPIRFSIQWYRRSAQKTMSRVENISKNNATMKHFDKNERQKLEFTDRARRQKSRWADARLHGEFVFVV